MSYPVFLIVGISVAAVIAVALAGPLSAVAIGFWVAHHFFLNWRNNSASLQAMSDSELFDTLDWWTGGGPFGTNNPELAHVRRTGTEDQMRAGLERVTGIFNEIIRRHENRGFSSSDYEYKRKQLTDELSRMPMKVEPN